MTDVSPELRATYEVYRLNLLMAWAADAPNLGAGFVFAHERRMSPVLDNNPDRPDPFEGCYRWSAEQVEAPLRYCTEQWDKGEPLTFYQLEAAFPGARHLLVSALRYSFLHRNYNQKFWDALLSDCPSEAHSIVSDPDKQALYL